MADRPLGDYVEVAERIEEFRKLYPEGSLRPWDQAQPYRLLQAQGFDKDGQVCQQMFLVVVAAAYRKAGDENPGVGMAWEIFPGRTNFTRGSELQNCETSAWGRAIIAVGAADAKRGVASREEVEARRAEVAENRAGKARAAAVDDVWTDQPAGTLPPASNLPPEDQPGSVDGKQHAVINAHFKALGVEDDTERRAQIAEIIDRPIVSRADLSFKEAEDVKRQLKARLDAQAKAGMRVAQ
jgi:hypothetical protein